MKMMNIDGELKRTFWTYAKEKKKVFYSKEAELKGDEKWVKVFFKHKTIIPEAP